MAALEGASVPAFRRLAQELRAVGASRKLVRAATRSARDEVAHTRSTARLARRFGARVPRFALARARTRSLFELAIENAVEGCVRESFGALVATYQASHARDPEVRIAMSRIARDETRHAALARAIDQWLSRRLTRDERSRVAAAKTAALAELAREIESPVHHDLRSEAGIPEPSAARFLLERAAHILAA
jgi:hypothetical protein